MNKNYNLKLDLQFRCNNSTMKFNQFDNNTSDFFMRITNGGNLVDIEKAIVVLATIKPSGKVSSQFVEVENGLVYADLKPSMKDEVGTYTARAMLILENEKVVTDTVSYEVEEDKIFSLLNDTVETTEEFTLLTDMLSRLSTIELNENNREETFNNIKDEFEIIKNNHNELVTAKTDNKVTELLDPVVSKANEKINEVDNKIVDIENAISEADSKINNAIAKIPPKSELIGEKGDKGEKGEKGDKGDRGEQGLQGIQGIQGIQGERGLQGIKGDKGDKGEQGIQGLKGDKGDKGDRGEQGVKGDTPSIAHLETSINNKIQEVETRFNTLTSTQQQSSEVIDARDGETSLKARLDRDLYKDGISLSDRIEAIEGLKDSQNMKYETDKGYLVCKETKNGVIDDLRIEGKTLVNIQKTSSGLYPDFSSTNTLVQGSTSKSYYYKVEIGKTYTFIKSPSDRYIAGCCNNVVAGASITKVNTTTNDTTKTMIDSFVATDNYFFIYGSSTNNDFNTILLEGDHTQNSPSYFEGLMSVGQDVDKIEVLSQPFEIKLENGTIDTINGNLVSSTTRVRSINYLKYNTITDIEGVDFNKFNILFYLYDKNYKYIKSSTFINNNYKFDVDGYYYKFVISKKDNSNIYISEIGNKLHQNYQSDKKQILFYNENGELEPIQELHEWDSIEKHSDNKWYYHKRSGKVVLNGNKGSFSVIQTTNQNDTIAFLIGGLVNSTSMVDNKDNFKCDKFNFKDVYLNDVNIEGVNIHLGYIRLSINKSKLSTQDVEGFKQWLQANNVTVVYQLAQEEVYELAPLHLDSYANETLILCNSGAISPKMEFSITSHINELVKAYGERINLLEEKVYKYMVTQNRMQLASTYSADSVTFKVDYFSLCGDEENYDEDLYNLILNNILVGKDNYNYDKMFTMILDYASWNQISWEQFDILVGLMDIQHNPPIEELPPEDVIEEDIIENETPVE